MHRKRTDITLWRCLPGTKAGSFEHLPRWLDFENASVRPCDMGDRSMRRYNGRGNGGWSWRIIRTLGHQVVKLQPVHRFAAETTAALIIQVASYYGIPLSTTHVISTSIMGVGAVKRFTGIRWTVVERIAGHRFRLPATALIGYVLERAIKTLTLNEPVPSIRNSGHTQAYPWDIR